MALQSTTITITAAGLNYAQITVTADSTVALAEHQAGSYLYYALLVDGRYFDLVRTAHADSNPTVVAAFNAALTEVEQAIAALNAPAPVKAMPSPMSCNLDTLIAAYEARPESRARASAWEYLSEATALRFDGDALLVPSATWSNTTYTATPTSCTCPGHAKGRACWHIEAATIVFNAREEDARIDFCESYESLAVAQREQQRADLARRIAHERLARSQAAVMELYA